jgi:hypothetical protein
MLVGMGAQGPRARPGTVEVEPAQILEERSRRPPPPLPGSTVEVQAVQIVDEQSCPPGSTDEAQPEQGDDPSESPEVTVEVRVSRSADPPPTPTRLRDGRCRSE